jgi:glycosyltransferase involved in cell wall biosynthesis
MCKISVVLPVYRTASCVPELFERLQAALSTVSEDYELIFVDDGSPDDAWALISGLAAREHRVKAIRLSRNFGQHPAISAGFEHASGDAIVLMDADLQDRPEDIPKLLGMLRDEVDIVYTVKTGPTEPLLTRLTSRIYHYVFSKLTGRAVPGNIGTLRVFSRKVLRALVRFRERSVLYGPLMFYVGFNYVVAPVQHDVRPQGTSGYSFRKRMALAVESVLSFSDLPQRALIRMGALIVVGSVLYAIALLVRYFVSTAPAPPGITLLAMLITFSLGSGMFGLGVVGLYVFRAYQEVLSRPRYLISASVNVIPRET